jgi:hypothetical protein
MRPRLGGRHRTGLRAVRVLAMTAALATGAFVESAHGADANGSNSVQPVSDTVWVDNDRRPIPRPRDWQPTYSGRRVREGFIDPVTHIVDIPDKLLGVADLVGVHTEREAVNVNAFDEVPNSSWFTNRNHVRAVPVSELEHGPDAPDLPDMPWTITKAKQSGWSVGFQIRDARGVSWLIKLDPVGHPQLTSGAGMVCRTLFYAAGYNLPHNEPIRFRREDVKIDEALQNETGAEHLSPAELDTLLAHGAVCADGTHSGTASRMLEGHVLGFPSLSKKRPGDTNDWYTPMNRRELRGLFVLCSWLGDWDMEDHQFLDAFVETGGSKGHVEHYFLDVDASLGAAAEGPKRPWEGYERAVDFAWIGRRIVTLGFVREPWRRARQDPGIPSVGRFESKVYDPGDFRTNVEQPQFRAMTDRDAYWGAKIVASFSNAQIAAAVGAVGYDDPRARDYLVQALIERRDKTARYWFHRVAPLDFFDVDDQALRFRDLAVDVGLEKPRAYVAEVETSGGRHSARRHLRLDASELPLSQIAGDARAMSIELRIAENDAKPAHVELERRNDQWIVTRVRHG